MEHTSTFTHISMSHIYTSHINRTINMIWQKPNSAIIHLTDFNMCVIKYCIYLSNIQPCKGCFIAEMLLPVNLLGCTKCHYTSINNQCTFTKHFSKIDISKNHLKVQIRIFTIAICSVSWICSMAEKKIWKKNLNKWHKSKLRHLNFLPISPDIHNI